MNQHDKTPEPRTVLHVGCGFHHRNKLHETFRTPAWREVRLDINPEVQPDIVASITDMRAVASGSCDALFSSHNLEHLHPHEVQPALKEFRRVLHPDGFALITLPDLEQVAERISKGKAEETIFETSQGPITALDILYGFRPSLAQGNLFMAHNFGFTAATLEKALREAGFAHISVQRDGVFNLWATAAPSVADTGGQPSDNAGKP